MWAERRYSLQCEGYGQTIWEHCFWVNNVGVIAGAVMFLVWLAGMMLGFRVVWPLWLRLLGYR